MKKFYKMSAAVLLALAMTACSSDSTAKTNDAESEEQTEEIGTGVYTITNLAGEGLEAGAFVELTKTVPATQTGDQVYTLEFGTESGYTGSFTTLHFKVVPIQLLAEDALTGATMISFSKPE